MNIKILELIEGARQAKGLTVIIDVYRAFSLETYLFAAGAEKILAVGKEQTARLLKMAHEDYILIGERGGKILPGFDYGNSPSQTKNAQLKGKTIIHTTSSGTQGLVNASGADRIITGSLTNAKAIANYIKQNNYENVSLVAMGIAGKSSAPEDLLCARYIKSLLENDPLDMKEELVKLGQTKESRKFFDPETQDIFPQEDFWMCIDYDKFDYVLEVQQIEKDVFEVHRRDL